MRAVRYHEHGDESVLRVDEVAPPDPGPGEVSIDVRAAAVNPVDVLYRKGILSPGSLPAVPGGDVAGVVDSVGPDVTEHAPGDRVFAAGLVAEPWAGYADVAIAPVDRVAPLPGTVEFDAAAASGTVGVTAWRALVDHGRVEPADVVLIHGGSGGVGHVAVQLADRVGASVVATAGSDAARERVRALGADEVLDYDREDLQDAVATTAPDGVDVVLDHMIDEYLPLDVAVAAHGATVVSITGDVPAVPDAGTARGKELTVQFMSASRNTPDVGAVLRRLAVLLGRGDLTVDVARRFDLDEAGEAQRFVDEESFVGKVVVVP